MKTPLLLAGYRYRDLQTLEKPKPYGVISFILLLLLIFLLARGLYFIWPDISSGQKLKRLYQVSLEEETIYIIPLFLLQILVIVGGLAYNVISRLIYGSALIVIDMRTGLVLYPYERRQEPLEKYKLITVRK